MSEIREIEKFDPQEYWTIEADMSHAGKPFESRLVRLENERLKQFDINTTEHAHGSGTAWQRQRAGKLTVNRVTRKQRQRRPAPPFITSTLQQDAARKLRFSAQRTMRTAQALYEGVEINGVSQGLITYMRTDSVHLSNDALADLRARIKAATARRIPA